MAQIDDRFWKIRAGNEWVSPIDNPGKAGVFVFCAVGMNRHIGGWMACSRAMRMAAKHG